MRPNLSHWHSSTICLMLYLVLAPISQAGTPTLVVQSGHTYPYSLTTASFSPDGRRVVTASMDMTAVVWDAVTGEKICSLSGHRGYVMSASFSPDGQRVVTASKDNTAVVWEPATGKKLRSFDAHKDSVNSVSFSPDGRRLVTASKDKTAIVWDAATGERLRSLAAHTDSVTWASFSPDGRRLVSASGDKTAIVWDVESGAKLRTLAGHTDRVLSASFSPDGRQVVTASLDKTVIVWDAESGAKFRTLAGHTEFVSSASYSPDGRRVVTASDDKTAVVWDTATGEKLLSLAGHTAGVTWASFSPDGRWVVTATADSTAIIWDATTGERLRSLAGHTAAVTGASFSPNGRRIVVTSADSTAVVWDAATGERLRILTGHTATVWSASFSPDNSRVVTASVDGTAIIWDAATGERLRSLAGHKSFVTSASFSSDNRWVVTASEDKTAAIWDVESGAKLRTFTGHTNTVTSACFSSDGRRVLTASKDKTAIVWDAATGERLRTLTGHTDYVMSASFSPDGRRILTASTDRTAVVWDAASGEKQRDVARFVYPFFSASFSPDGRRIVTATADQVAIIWDPSLKEQPVLNGHTSAVMSASFSPDGLRVLTASIDGTTRLWDAATGRQLASLFSFDSGEDWLTVTPEGYYQGTLPGERMVRWRVDDGVGGWPRMIGPEQLRETFYRPDLFRFLLKEFEVRKALGLADAERGKRSTPTSVEKEIPPVVLIVEPRNLAKVERPEVAVRAVATGVARPVESLQLILNGQPEGRIRQVQVPRLGQVEDEWSSVRLTPGENTIRVLARAGGSEGKSDEIRVIYQSREQVSVRLRILIIGVDRYKLAPEAGGYPTLRKAASGAREVGEAFVRYGRGLYTEVLPPTVLLDQAASRDSVLDALDQFSRDMTRDDVGVIFYAGHGDKNNDRLYLGVHDTDKARLVRTGISASQLRDILAGTKGRVYLFLDACHAGAITQRSGPVDSLHENLIRELRREATGTFIATACRGDERANETEEIGGFFTRALVEGLSGKARSATGAVYARGLKNYVEERVRELTRPLDARHQQRPYFDGSEELMDVPLVKP